jgi:LPXTG-motif cell wall-anchored protein
MSASAGCAAQADAVRMTDGSGQGVDVADAAGVVDRTRIRWVRAVGITAVLAGVTLIGLTPVPAGASFVGLTIPRLAWADDPSAPPATALGFGPTVPAPSTPASSLVTSPTTDLVAPLVGESDEALPSDAAIPQEQIIGAGSPTGTVPAGNRPTGVPVTRLPVTGTDVGSTVTLGTSLIVGGLLLLAVRRRQPRPARPRPAEDDIRRPTVLRRR